MSMKLFVLGATLLSMASSAFALTPRTGEYTCRRLGHAVYTCLSYIKDKTVDEYASGACDRMNDVDSTFQCMKVITGHAFQMNAVVACDRIEDVTLTNRCLGTISDCHFTESAVQECDSVSSVTATIGCFKYYCEK